MKKNERSEQEYRDAAKNSFSFAGMCRYLGLGAFGANYRRLHKAIDEYGIDVSHFTGQGWNVGMIFNPMDKKKKSLDEILIENSDYDNTNTLKNRLFNEGVKEERCEKCGLTEWNGEPIPLQLHHINGNRRDNRLENLQILCPNCHAQTDNFCGKNVDKPKRRSLNKIERYEKVKEAYGEEFAIKTFGIIEQKKNKPKQKKFCPVCGKELKKSEYTYCSLECSHKSTKKLPEDSIIINHIKDGLTNQEIGDIYGVTEACVRKWKKKHNI